MSSSSSKDRDSLVKEFCMITGAGAAVGEQLLSVCNDNLEMAINMHMEGVEIPGTSSGSAPSGSTSSSGGGAKSASQSAKSVGAAAATAYDDDEEPVRAPIPQKQDRMVEPGYEGYYLNRPNPNRARIRSVFDGFRNFSNESASGGAATAVGSGGESGNGVSRGKKRTLEELFKPPLDLMFKGDFVSARDAASKSKKWLLVNIQDAGEFQCQVLNRDVWSNKAVKTVINEHFLFWQQYKESEEAQRFLTFYPASEWPYVTVLDPRTGEKLVTWNKLDAKTFCDLVTSFLQLQPQFEPSKDDDKNGSSSSNGRNKAVAPDDGSPAAKRGRHLDPDSIIDADEDDQLAAAIRASLAETSAASVTGNGSKAHGNSEGDKPTATATTHKNKTESGDDNSDDNEDNNEESDYDLDFTDDDTNMSTPAKAPPTADDDVTTANIPSLPKMKPLTSSEEADCDWEDHLGNPDDPKSSIMIRFPDGKREAKNIPCSSTFMAIIKYVRSQGYPLDSHEIVTNFPRRILTDLDSTQTLKQLGLFPQETVFVQKR